MIPEKRVVGTEYHIGDDVTVRTDLVPGKTYYHHGGSCGVRASTKQPALGGRSVHIKAIMTQGSAYAYVSDGDVLLSDGMILGLTKDLNQPCIHDQRLMELIEV